MIDNILSTINKTKDYFTDLVIANFNESLLLFSGLERNISGQPVIPSPAKTKTTMAPTKGRQPTKLDPAPRDTAPSGSVSYPQNKEGGLNKFAKTEKDKRSARAVDNFDINFKQRFKHDYKTTTDVMGLNVLFAQVYL